MIRAFGRLAIALCLFLPLGAAAKAQVNCFPASGSSACVTLSGALSGSNGSAARNYTINFTPTQWFYVAGTGVVVNTTTQCATSTDGTVVGLPNPNAITLASANFFGTLPPGNYYYRYTFYQTVGGTIYETLPSIERSIQLTSTGSITIQAPAQGIPQLATGMRLYISSSPGAETLQGATTGNNPFIQNVPLVTGAAVPSANNSICRQVANDAGWPTGTGYNIAVTDASGNSIPGYPMQWQLLGPGTTINLSTGLPYYHGTVTYPSPILATPQNHAAQSISGPLSMSGYAVSNVAQLGVGTATPAWGVDVEGAGLSALINAAGGYLYNGGAPNGHCLVGNGTAYVDAVCPGTTPSVFYQTVAANGTAQTQRPTLNFSSRFAATDSASPAQTNVDVNTTGSEPELVTAATSGVNQNCAMWDANGGITDSGVPCVNIIQNDEYFTAPACAFSADTNNTSCAETVNLASSMPDANYFVNCTPITQNPGTSSFGYVMVLGGTKTSSNFQVVLVEQLGNSAGAGNTWNGLDCHVHHN